MAKPKPKYYRAREGFVTMFEDNQEAVAAGTLVPAGHKILKGREDLFEPVTSLSRFDVDTTEADEKEPEVEQATAAPGEKRGVEPKATGKK
jgi:hypothetical protein